MTGPTIDPRPRSPRGTPMTTVTHPTPTTAPTAAPTPRVPVRRTGPSPAVLIALEVRKSLSTRSGRAVAIAAVVLGPVVMAMLAGADQPEGPAASIGEIGLFAVLVVAALGVLSTAGEWTHRTVQTTFLVVPQRGRVLAAKATAMALLGGVLGAVSAGVSALVFAALADGGDWDGVPRAIAVVTAASAVFAVTGAGIGAAVGNSAAALTGTYLVLLVVLPLLRSVQPELTERLDPTGAVLTLTADGVSTTPVLVLVGWTIVSTVAGVLVTRRRAVA